MQAFQRKFFIVLIAVVFVAITAAGAGVYGPKKMNVEKSMADRAVQPQKPFEGDGGSYRTFVNSTAEGHTVYVRYYFFNLTNGPSVVAGAPPKFTTVGPYTYQKIKTCFDVVFQDGNGTVRFKEHTKHMWIPELSKSDTDGRQLSEDDIIVQMNMPLYRLTATAAMQCAAGNTTLWSSLNSIMERTGSSLFVPRKVHAHLWGYDDALLRALGQPSHHHGFFTQDSQDTMDTEKRTGSMGLGTSSQFTMIKGLRTLLWWKSSEANRLDGWDTQYPPNNKVGRSTVLRRWLSPLYRIGTLIYEKDVIMHNVKLKRFVLASKIGDINSDFYMTTKGFLPSPPGRGDPVVHSMGNYFEANLTFVNVSVDGNNPPKLDHTKHVFYADVEPLSGKILREHNRLQMNVWLAPRSCNGDVLPDEIYLPTTWWPCVIFDESAAAPNKLFDEIAGLSADLDIAMGPGLALFLLGLLGTVFCIAQYVSIPATATEDGVKDHQMIAVAPVAGGGEGVDALSGSPAKPQEPQTPSFAQRCWQQIGPPFRYASIVLRFSVVEGLLLLAYMLPLASEYVFQLDNRNTLGHLRADSLYLLFILVPVYSQLCLSPHLILRACVAECADATYWQRVSMVQTLFFTGVPIVLHGLAIPTAEWESDPDYKLANTASVGILLLIHIPLTFYSIGRALKQSMFLCWLAYTLEFLNNAVMFYAAAYRASPAFQWTSPFIFVFTSMFSKYAVKQASSIPPAATQRLLFQSLLFGGFFTRLSQSVVYGNARFAIFLEVYYAVLSLFFRVTLYQRFRFISRLVEVGINKILCWEITAPEPPSERSVHVSSMATISETVYESACFHFFFVLRFITYPPPNMSGIEALGLFFVCKAIQYLNDALTAYVVFKYEGIVLLEYASVKKLKSQVFFWWVSLMLVIIFLSFTGGAYDPAIKPPF